MNTSDQPPRDLPARLVAVRQSLATAARQCGRDPATIRLLAVSKAQAAASLRTMHALGVKEFGENYAQEMAAKDAALADLTQPGDLRFVFIGTLQSNKIPLIVRLASEIQSVGTERHARLVAQAAVAAGKVPYPIFLLVNAGDEATKSGFKLAEVEAAATAIARDLPDLDIQGLMAIPPPLASPAQGGSTTAPPALYRTLRAAASRVGRGRLSLGMTQDLAAAVAAGTDCVRIGTALFGERQ